MLETVSNVAEGQRFLMLDYLGGALDTWQVIHTVAMPSGGVRALVFNVAQPADMFDIYVDELADPGRFVCLDGVAPAVPYGVAKRAA